MMLRLPVPRLLPFTIAALAVVLALKTVDLARYAAAAHHGASAVVAEAHAAAPEKAPQKAPEQAAGPAPGKAATAMAPPPVATPSLATGQPPPVSDSERAILLELRQRRQQLDSRDAAVAARESILAAAEQKLAAQARARTALQQQLQDLEAARKQIDKIAAIVTDSRMPGVHGPRLIARIRALRPGIPAILVSGNMVEHETDRSIVFLTKPVSPAVLTGELRRLLSAGV